jgi:tetratricopeptide (TPR) repeat protein
MSNLSKLLAKGGALARQGDAAGARAVFEKAVSEHGNRSEPWISLSAIHGMQGNYTEALRCARKAVELSPNSLQGWVNLASSAQSCGELARAAEAYQRARGLPGCPPDVTLELGLTLARMGKWAEAEQPLREYLSRHSGHREATLILSKVLASKGGIEAAIAISEEYCHHQPGDVHALLELGAIYHESGRDRDAWRICDQAAKAAPAAADVLFFKAALLTHDGHFAEARDVYEQLDRLHPGNQQVLMALCQVCSELADGDASIAYARAVLKLNPRNVEALLSLSSAMSHRDTTEAWRLLDEALAIAPNEPAALVHKGELLELAGDKLGAWECVRPVIESGSTSVRAARVAANVAPAIGRSEEAIAHIERLVNKSGISFSDHRILRFTLANLCDKAKQYDRAFEHAIIANRLKNVRHDDNALMVQINQLKAVYSETTITSLPRSGIRSELPIFIVGMPRSGTSLLEQILSCHSKVHARGETSDIPTIAEAIPYYPDGARNLTSEKLNAWADAHLRRVGEMATTAIRVTDKLPGNFLFLGLITQLFPGARILNCRRDPRDVCLSNFMTDFDAGHEHSYNLESLALVCKAYQELMEYWKRILPIPILDVRYEELTADPRTQIEKILTFCGLEWEEACLSFHQSKRQVVTASYDQVREPLHKRSVARWKNYARHLEPVIRILGLHDDTYS